LQRRLDIWELVLTPVEPIVAAPPVNLRQFQLALADVDKMMGQSRHGRDWREYLLIESLQEAVTDESPSATAERKALARQALGRVAGTSLTDSQRAFLATEPMNRLAMHLRRMASGMPNRAYLLAVMERYELRGRASDARRLADECLWLAYWPQERLGELQRRIAMHYRNANLRIVLSEMLLNRLMPERMPEYERVSDTILGNPVKGESLTATDVAIQLIPDNRRLRLALEITGEVAALTSSNSGPAMFQNTSESHYTARKPMELTVDGLKLWPAEVSQVSNVTRLRRLKTSFDGVPILGSFIKNVAKTQHDMMKPEVRREIERKVSTRAKKRIDNEANARLSRFSERLAERVLKPMNGMSLGPQMVQAKTTNNRLTMRLRVASRHQLGANTPRPMAPGNSQASFQVHQTALNNMVEQLDLDGQTLTLPELRERLAKRLNWPELKNRTTEHDDVTIRFAEKDAIRVTCNDGLITLDLVIDRLRKGRRRSWKYFQVRVNYRPQVQGLSAQLVRDGVVELPGRRVPLGSQVALRAIFCKIFAENATREIVPDRIRNHPKMGDIVVTQMIVEDGWIAFALGPKPQVARGKGGRKTK
jgi:hypothetical protein